MSEPDSKRLSYAGLKTTSELMFLSGQSGLDRVPGPIGPVGLCLPGAPGPQGEQGPVGIIGFTGNNSTGDSGVCILYQSSHSNLGKKKSLNN